MKFDKSKVDYSLYLVTDSTLLPEGTTLYSQVEAGLQNGVTIVQLREKKCDTREFIEQGLKIKQLCHRYNVPLIVNDRVDVAMAIGADGVHVGQDDMPIVMVRGLLGPDKILGWSVSKKSEVEQIARWGPGMVDNIGIGMVFPTLTKKDSKVAPMGPQGVITILDALEQHSCDWVKTVAIGGLHPDNVERLLYQCSSQDDVRRLDGIAVVSDIIASSDAANATSNLRQLLDQNIYSFIESEVNTMFLSMTEPNDIITSIKFQKPLIHHVTNKVHQNVAANVTLAVGGSPIMSEVSSEFRELSEIPNSALLLNTGTVQTVETLKIAVKAYNESRRPIVFDPVGYSATTTRKLMNDTLLSYGQFTCIKCNVSEMMSLAEMTTEKMRGVDSSSSEIDIKHLVAATRKVAFKYKTIAVCTGKIDVVVNGTINKNYNLGKRAAIYAVDKLPGVKIFAGDIPLMGSITASGCSLGSVIATSLGARNTSNNAFISVITAVMLYKAAGKLASSVSNGSGSFQVEILNSLYQLSNKNIPSKWGVSCIEI